MIKHDDISPGILFRKIKSNEIVLAGNKKLKIYGMLICASGKRMKKENRVFFTSEKEAVENGYRPCGHCMNRKYKSWSRGTLSEKRLDLD